MTSDLPQTKARRLIGICSLVRTTIDRDQRFQLRRSKFAQRENMESSTTTTTTTPSEITLEHGLSNVGKSDAPKHFRHKAYRDGKPRPLLRGWLHAFVSCVLVLAILASIVSPVFRTILGATWYEQMSFLAGKLLSYGASAYYHIVDFKSLAWSRWANVMDLVLIAPAMWGICALCAPANSLGTGTRVSHWMGELYVLIGTSISSPALLACPCLALFAIDFRSTLMHGLTGRNLHTSPKSAVLLANAVAVHLQFASKIPGGSELRNIVLVVYYIWSELCIYSLCVGWELSPFALVYDPRSVPVAARLWYCTVVFYLASFACAKVVDDFRMKECAIFPWHWWPRVRGRWTLHEEFHVLLLVADFCVLSGVIERYRATN